MNESSNNLGNSDIFSQSSIDLWEAAKADPNGISASGYPNYVAYPNTDWWDEILYEAMDAEAHDFTQWQGEENRLFNELFLYR